MDFSDILASFPPESDTLEYKRKRADKAAVVTELVAFANTDGGTLVYGVKEENGTITGFDDFHDFQAYEEEISNLLGARVRPRITCEIVELDHEGHTLMGFSVEGSTVLHTFRDGKPYIPSRMGSTTDYLEGDAIVQHYRATLGAESDTQPSAQVQWLHDLRNEAQAIRFQYRDVDLAERDGRRKFQERAAELVENVEGLLERRPPQVSEEARDCAAALLENAREVTDADTSATPAPVVITAATDRRRGRRDRRSRRSGSPGSRRGDTTDDSPDYVGETPEEIEDAFRDLAAALTEVADEVIELVDETIY
jgi:UrcA family protein